LNNEEVLRHVNGEDDRVSFVVVRKCWCAAAQGDCHTERDYDGSFRERAKQRE